MNTIPSTPSADAGLEIATDSGAELPPFTIPAVDLVEIGRRGYASIPVRVVGFWSEVITIAVSREQHYKLNAEWEASWEVEVTHSSGGYEDGDKLIAESNFAAAIVASVKTAYALRANSFAMEQAYQARQAEAEAAKAAADAERQARIDADPFLGHERAALLFDLAKTSAALDGAADLTVVERGGADDNTTRLEFSRRPGSGSVRVDRAGRALARKEAIEILAQSSRRSHVAPKAVTE